MTTDIALPTSPEDSVSPSTVAADPSAAVRALYVHLPFCERRCEYCDFAAVASLRGHRAYVSALRRELERLASALPEATLTSIFLGGGTPSFLPPDLLATLLADIRALFRVAPDCEVTVEANPSSTSEARADSWLLAGVNRVSIGVQSLDRRALAFLGRVHDPEQALAAIAAVRRVGVPRISCDLIYGIPGLDDAAWRATLEQVLGAGIGHLSCYELTVEAGTPLAEAVASGEVVPVDEDTALRQHWMAVDLAADAGLRQYEVSNHARPGEECRHNLAYWRRAYYAAVGVGAHAHVPVEIALRLGVAPRRGGEVADVRFWHVRSPDEYVASVAAGGMGIAGAEGIDVAAAEVERIMLGLRLADGVTLPGRLLGVADDLVRGGLLEGGGEGEGWRVRATRRGQEVLSAVTARLVAAL